MIERGILMDAMTKVKDMARSALYTIENPLDFLFNQMEGTKKDDRIEVPLNSDIISQAPPCLTQINSPIHSDHIPSCLLHPF